MISEFNKKAEAYLSKRKHSKSALRLDQVYVDPDGVRFADFKYTQSLRISKGQESIEKSVFLYRRDFNFALYAFPLSVLATNRMNNTLISRQPSSSALKDLSLIRQCQPQGLLLGLGPYLAFSLYNSVEVHSFEKKQGQYVPRESFKQRILSKVVDFTYF